MASTTEGQDTVKAPVLRKVEKDVVIPRRMDIKISRELCYEEHNTYQNCAKESGFLVFIKCKPAYKVYTDCSNRWFNDEQFRKEMEEEYLKARRKYRKEGIPDEVNSRRLGH